MNRWMWNEAVNIEANQKRRNAKAKHPDDGDNYGDDNGSNEPGLFDAEIFSYTHLILDPRMGIAMTESRLARSLLRYENLVAHRRRVLERFYYRRGGGGLKVFGHP